MPDYAPDDPRRLVAEGGVAIDDSAPADYIPPFRPLRDRVIIADDRLESATEGGVIIPSAYRLQTNAGTVVAVGPNVRELRVGARVMFRADDGVGRIRYPGPDGEMVSWRVAREEQVRLIVEADND